MLCIICNENSEKIWPKRWQCWKENGKFSESICKLLGLPKYPYEADFQKSVYCSPCQKRVYDIYLMVRKWDKILGDISKLKGQLEEDFQQSLDKGKDNLNSPDLTEIVAGTREESDTDTCSSLEPDRVLNYVRRRILKRLSRTSGCEFNCCCDSEEQKGKSQCNVSSCRDTSCGDREGKHNKSDDNADGGSSYWSSDDGDEEEGEGCTAPCCNPEKSSHQTDNQKHNPSQPCCSSEYCVDCTICNSKVGTGSHHGHGGHSSHHENHQVCGRTGQVQEMSAPEADLFSLIEKVDVDTDKKYEDETRKPQKSKSKTSSKSYASNAPEIPPKENGFTTNFMSMENISVEDMAYMERLRCYRGNCTRSFGTQEELDIHVKRHHEGTKCPYVCAECGKTFQWKRELDAHQLKHSGGITVCCDLCGRGFRTKRLLNIHLKTKHAGERKYKCSQCEKSFISQSKLTTHLTVHTKSFPFSCKVCGKGFSAVTFLNFHMKKHTETSPFKCLTCDKTFANPRNLQVHQFTHTQTYPFRCPICEIGVSTESLLKKHMIKHTDEKSYICEICNKKFRFPSSLKKHKKVHLGDKQFQCEVCNKTFIDKYKLRRHLRTHSGEKPHQCHVCLKKFQTKDNLSAHIKNHEKIASEMISSLESTFVPTEDLHSDSLQQSYYSPEESLPVIATSVPDNLEDTLIATSEPDNLEDTLIATIEFDNFADSLLINDAFHESEETLMDLNVAGPLVISTFSPHDTDEFLDNEFSSFSFQQL